jgi:hypothetical protein
VKGISKLWPERYQLKDFGLGFMRLAWRRDAHRAGGDHRLEEQAPALLNLRSVGKLIGFPALPVTVTPLPLPDEVPPLLRRPADLLRSADDEDTELDRRSGW